MTEFKSGDFAMMSKEGTVCVVKEVNGDQATVIRLQLTQYGDDVILMEENTHLTAVEQIDDSFINISSKLYQASQSIKNGDDIFTYKK